MNIIGVIPARYNSSRLPGKPLLQIHGKSMLERVYLQASKVKILKKVYIATDDDRIYKHAQDIKADVIMTSSLHQNGTSRCNEAAELISEEADYIINIQGDEPMIEPHVIENLCTNAVNNNAEIATSISYINKLNELNSCSEVKVVTNTSGYALYFSRSTIPFIPKSQQIEGIQKKIFKKHLGLYIFKKNILKKLCTIKETALAQAESLEQLNWLESGYKILTVLVNSNSIPIDTPQDIQKALKFFKSKDI